MKSQLRTIVQDGHEYQALAFVCPGCNNSLHMLPVSGDIPPGKPRWDFDGNLEAPTLSPSILTRMGSEATGPFVCHSFLRDGVFQFLMDSTHELRGREALIPDLPEWAIS